MNALIQSLQEKIGLTAEQAKDAANHMMEYIKKSSCCLARTPGCAAIGESIKTKGAEFLAQAQSKGGDFFHIAQEKAQAFAFLAQVWKYGSMGV